MNNSTVVIQRTSDLINKQMLYSITVEVFGHYYIAQKNSEDIEGIMYSPKSESLLLFNSFLPDVFVETRKEPTKTTLFFKSKYQKNVRSSLFIFYTLCLLFQIALIFFSLSRTPVDIIPFFIPSFIAGFLFALSSISRSIAFSTFTMKYRIQIEKYLIT